jgi:hypothetical protein
LGHAGTVADHKSVQGNQNTKQTNGIWRIPKRLTAMPDQNQSCLHRWHGRGDAIFSTRSGRDVAAIKPVNTALAG